MPAKGPAPPLELDDAPFDCRAGDDTGEEEGGAWPPALSDAAAPGMYVTGLCWRPLAIDDDDDDDDDAPGALEPAAAAALEEEDEAAEEGGGEDAEEADADATAGDATAVPPVLAAVPAVPCLDGRDAADEGRSGARASAAALTASKLVGTSSLMRHSSGSTGTGPFGRINT